MCDKERKPSGYWTRERCFEAAKECKTKKEFYERFPSVYQISYRKKWLSDYIWLESKQKPNGYWNNYEHCYSAAKECKTISEFILKFFSAYQSAKTNNWIEDYTWIEHNKKPNGYWNYENCYKVALECNTRGEFEQTYHSAYTVACKNGWINNYTWFIRCNNYFTDRVNYVYAYLFEKQHTVYVGRTNDITGRNWQHKNKDCPVKRFAENHNTVIPEITILESKLNLEESLIYEDLYVEQYKLDGWNLINKAKTGVGCGSIGKIHKKWTENACYNVALNCQTKSEFKKKYCSAYNVARKNGWIDNYNWFVDGNKLYDKDEHKPKRVLQYTLEGEFIREWPSLSEIRKQLGFSHSHISDCCKSNKTSCGYIWKYAA